jgi:hypothetical protein
MSAYQSLKFTITGVSPLLMHNGQLVDPLNYYSQKLKEVTKKRTKTDADHDEMGRIEFYGGLYLSNGEPCIPGEVLEAAVIRGAMKEKRGPQAKAAILIHNNPALQYDGPRTPEELWKDERFRLRVAAKVGQAKVMRTRPKFDNWSADVDIKFLPSLLNAKEVKSFLVTAGEQIGIGDWRPRFGRFEVA